MSTEVAEAVAALSLVDHHVHTCSAGSPSLAELGDLLTESDRPAARGTSRFDSQVGFAVRRHCAPLLGLPAHAPIEDYWAARQLLAPDELDRRLLGAAGVDRWLVDTGFNGDQILDLDAFATRVPGSRVQEIVRLESVLEEVVADATAATLEERFREALSSASADAAGLKSVIAYRHGFDFDPARPSPSEVSAAAGRWLAELDAGAAARVTDPVLLRMALWAGVDTGLPLQLHAGYGDPDLDLRRCDPLLLSDWIKRVEPLGTDVVLLHCYPFHRHAGYLAQAFPHVYFDVGLAVNFTGAASAAVVAESLELAPFAKVLYSSDAWGPPELHLLGSLLWRAGLTRTLSRWVADGEWSVPDAIRVATMVGRTNASLVYGGHDG
ncbi:amidohydrolase family protein [Nocardioides lijunqiniae]|uniref:amidohydrolase family protein n=1 Tax=Nocardioides lijunqiniae TaxID=2760832 RepID=UPI0018781D7D|nr:amidohydrolase family protein [Nocardioides lijunqiniae]